MQLPEHDDLWDDVSLEHRDRIEKRYDETIKSVFFVGMIGGCVVGWMIGRFVWPVLFSN